MPVKRYSAPTVCMAAHAAMFFIRSIVVDLLSLPTVEPPKVLEARTIWPRDLLSGSGGKESGMAISLSSREWLHGPNGSAGFTNVSIYIPSSNRTARQRFIQEKKKTPQNAPRSHGSTLAERGQCIHHGSVSHGNGPWSRVVCICACSRMFPLGQCFTLGPVLGPSRTLVIS